MIIWATNAWEEFVTVYKRDQKSIKKIIKLIEDIERNGNTGIGKPEPLKGGLAGYWSRRIDSKNRLVYKIEDGVIKIAQCATHYHEK